jgi:MoaA/NifB/PqqE/SkfB family radical SAM enzyme
MRCNMKCSYCDLWKRDHSDEIDPEHWKTVLSDLLDVLGQPKINFSGGEPLLSPVIFDLLQICAERGAYPGFVTNGRLLTQQNIERLAQLNISNINISLDDDRPDVFDHVRNAPGHTRSLLANIESLQAALRERHCNTAVYLKSVVHAENADRLVHLVELAKDKGCTITFQPLSSPFGRAFRPDWYKEEPLWPSGERLTLLHRAIDALIDMKRANAPIGNSASEMARWHQYFDAPEQFQKNNDESPCLIGYSNLFIFSNGDIKYCPARRAVGNVKHQSVRDILMCAESEREVVNMRKCRGHACVKTCMAQRGLLEMIRLFFRFVAGK